MGLGRRHVPLDNINWEQQTFIDQPLEKPGVGSYDIGKMADENSAPTWK